LHSGPSVGEFDFHRDFSRIGRNVYRLRVEVEIDQLGRVRVGLSESDRDDREGQNERSRHAPYQSS
jgi:hypothetical protein